MKNEIIHQHLIFQSKVDPIFNIDESTLKSFSDELLEHIKMTCLIPARVKLSNNNAWTGIVGIITSHIAFHYWVDQKELQVDIYSCRPFDEHEAVHYIIAKWRATEVRALSLRREVGKDFDIVHIRPG